jgi:uncharacterized membrane protein
VKVVETIALIAQVQQTVLPAILQQLQLDSLSKMEYANHVLMAVCIAQVLHSVLLAAITQKLS